jgi:hypothetical protein
MNPPLNNEIVWTCALTEQLPQLQSWVGGGLWPDGADIGIAVGRVGGFVYSAVTFILP